MSRRIDVELTSVREDGTWTWRAAGAKQPKGTVDASILPGGAKVGDVLKAEADFDIEGITLLSIVGVPGKQRDRDPQRIEIIGGRFEPGVTTNLVSKGDRPRGARRDREGGAPGDTRDRRDRRDRPAGGDRPPRPAGGERRDRPPRPEGERTGGRGPGAPATGARPDRGRPARPGGDRRDRPAGDRPAGDRRDRAGAGARPDPRKRFSPGTTHRRAVIDTLPLEQRPVAEQVIKGGIPAVRQAVEAQNAAAREEGLPEVPAAPLLAMAEELLPRLKAAEWRDRADAAMADLDGIPLRDLRSIVAGADAAARDDENRELARTLREALQRRVDEHRQRWLTELTTALDEGRVLRALNLSARTPDPTTRVPADVAVRLAEAAGQAMSAETPPDRWSDLLDAVVASPVRASVRPAGLPAQPPDALLQAARQAAGRVPALAPMLGIAIPPPPRAGQAGATPAGRRGAIRPVGGARPRPGAKARPIPPPPQVAPAGAEPTADVAEVAPVADPPVEGAPVEAPAPAAEGAVEDPAADVAVVADAPVEEDPAADVAPVADVPVEDLPVDGAGASAAADDAPVEEIRAGNEPLPGDDAPDEAGDGGAPQHRPED